MKFRLWLNIIGFVLSAKAYAAKTDVVILRNADRITGEIKELRQGKLRYSTDDIGTIYIEWDNVDQIYSPTNFEFVTTTGGKYFGSIGWAAPGKLKVVTPAGSTMLEMDDIVLLYPIKAGFFNRLVGSVSIGFSYTRASNIAQGNASADVTHRDRKQTNKLTYSSIVTYSSNKTEATKQDAGYSYNQLLEKKFYWQTGLTWQQNSELGILSRTSLNGQMGKFLLYTNRNTFQAGGGLLVNTETTYENTTTENIEASLILNYEYFSFDDPKLSIHFHYYLFPSLTVANRIRQDLEAETKWKIISDFTISLKLYYTTDNNPQSTQASNQDWGIISSLGYTF